MIDSFVTQCPHCRTSFRVSSSQLKAANGAVRCGACLHVFNAPQFLLENPKSSAQAGTLTTGVPPAETQSESSLTPESSLPVTKVPLDTAWIHDDLDLDSLDLDEELARVEQEEQEEQPRADDFVLQESSPEQLPEDEAWAERLFEESQQSDAKQTEASTVETPTDDSGESTTSEAPIELDLIVAERLEPTIGQTPEGQDALTEAEDIEEVELTAADAVADADTTTPSSRNAALFDLSDDPLLLEWRAPSTPWGRWLGWGALNLLAVAALIGQVATYNFQELARRDQYRPWFEMLCAQLDCKMPSLVDINLIKNSNLVVRSHPDFAGALVVDAIIYNRAGFSQPFPLLELRFSNINGQLLANRRFKPSEYLAGELAGQNEMPPQTPIHISLDILDPGQEAVNYSLTFQSPE